MNQAAASPRVLFRIDAGPCVGLGHLQRSLSLAGALRRRQIDSVFLVPALPAVREWVAATGCDVETAARAPANAVEDLEQVNAACRARDCHMVVVDSYHTDAAYLEQLGRRGLVVAMIDDHAAHPMPCRMVINAGAHAEQLRYEVPWPQTTLLLGPRYALLRQEFDGCAPRRPSPEVREVLVMAGGGDAGALLARLLETVDTVNGSFEVKAVVGPFVEVEGTLEALAARCRRRVQLVRQPREVRALMCQADAAVSAAGQTLYELACAGCPTVAIEMADNQRPQLRALAARGCVVDAGRAESPATQEAVRLALQRLVDDAALRMRIAHAQQQCVDGRGAQRVADALEALARRN